MERARRHQRLLSALAFCLLCAVAELVGAALTHRIDLGRHVRSPSYRHAVYYPALVAAVKVGVALLLARLAWRLARARASARAATRVVGVVKGDVPRLRVTLSPRLWLAFFAIPASVHLLHADAVHVAGGRWALFFPWVHSSALPVFAVLGVLTALLWCVVQRWLADYEEYAAEAARLAGRLLRAAEARLEFPQAVPAVAPRRLFGLALDSRPPPASA